MFTRSQPRDRARSPFEGATVDERRLIPTVARSVAEIATVDSVEGLLLRPERIPGVIP